MKLLIIITDYGSFNGFLSELAMSLIADGAQIDVICSKDKIIDIADKFSYEGHKIKFHIVDFPRKPSIWKQVRTAGRINKLINLIRPNLVHAHFTTGIFPTLLFRKRGLDYWGTFHGLGLNATSGLKKWLFIVLEHFCFSRLNKIFVLNKKDLDLVTAYYPEKVCKYSSYGIGCDLNKFDPILYPLEKLSVYRDELSLNDKFVITYTGRFVAFKGFDLVYHTFTRLNRDFPNKYKLLLMGGSDALHPTGLNKQEFDDLNNNENILNIGFTSEVPKYLALSNLFFFPSKKEGLPTCIIEALSMGLPVLTLNERGNNDIIQHGYNGVLVESDTQDQEIKNLYQAISKLSEDPEKLETLGRMALKDREQYSRSLFIEEHRRLYKDYFRQHGGYHNEIN